MMAAHHQRPLRCWKTCRRTVISVAAGAAIELRSDGLLILKCESTFRASGSNNIPTDALRMDNNTIRGPPTPT